MVSIIVPVYNIEKYLPHCVKSLLGQTYKDLEILLVNDGSTDGSGALCNSLAASDRRVKAIHKENGGLSDARNAGLDNAAGDWVLFVDGDDYLAENAVERLIALTEPDVDFVQFLYQETEDISWKPDENQPANPVACTDQQTMWHWLYEKGGVAASSCTKLWARRLFDGLRFKKGILHEDQEIINHILPLCWKVIYTDLVLYGYVMRGDSIVHAEFRPKNMDLFSVLEERAAVLEELGIKDLALDTRKWITETAIAQYCLARKGGFDREANELKQRILTSAKLDALPLRGQYQLVYRLAKYIPFAPEIYYFIRKITGKT